MTANLIPFDFDGTAVRGLNIDGDPWFVAKDVADALGYANPQKAIRDHCKGARPVGVNESFTLDPQTTIIPERDLYRLVMRSKLPAAERFEDWVVGDVLPAIRKTGRYEAPAPQTATGESYVQIPAHEYITLLNKLTTAQDRAMTLRERNSEIMGLNQYKGVAEILINETTLSDEEIAARLESLLGRYMPEWVAWNRRLLSGVQPS
jgi:prophage antirepressor-like protein